MGPSRSCWNGKTSAIQSEEITSKGNRISCVYYQKKCPYEKSLETYLMILVYVNINCEDKALGSWFVWQNWCQVTTAEKAKQCQNFPLFKVHNDWTSELLNKVFWNDETNFENFQPNKRIYMWCIVGERAPTLCITSAVKHEGGYLMVWGPLPIAK